MQYAGPSPSILREGLSLRGCLLVDVRVLVPIWNKGVMLPRHLARQHHSDSAQMCVPWQITKVKLTDLLQVFLGSADIVNNPAGCILDAVSDVSDAGKCSRSVRTLHGTGCLGEAQPAWQ